MNFTKQRASKGNPSHRSQSSLVRCDRIQSLVTEGFTDTNGTLIHRKSVLVINGPGTSGDSCPRLVGCWFFDWLLLGHVLHSNGPLARLASYA